MGRQACRLRTSRPVQHEDAGRRQRAVGPSIPGALREVQEGPRREAPGDPARGECGSVHRTRELQDAVGGPARGRRRLRGRALLRPPDWFLKNVGRYDTYPRTGPKIFVREYAAPLPARGDASMRPSTLTAAVAEAVFMTGFERNADLVEMSSYAPLFAHVDAWQWTPNLIWFDNLESFGTPSYYAQQTFGQNRGTTILPITVDGDPKNGHGGVFSSASMDAATKEVIVKLVNPDTTPHDITLSLDGAQSGSGGRVIALAGAPDGENSLTSPKAVAPVASAFAPGASPMSYTIPPNSIAVLRVPIR